MVHLNKNRQQIAWIVMNAGISHNNEFHKLILKNQVYYKETNQNVFKKTSHGGAVGDW